MQAAVHQSCQCRMESGTADRDMGKRNPFGIGLRTRVRPKAGKLGLDAEKLALYVE